MEMWRTQTAQDVWSAGLPPTAISRAPRPPQHVAAEWHCLALTTKRRAEMLANETKEREGFK